MMVFGPNGQPTPELEEKLRQVRAWLLANLPRPRPAAPKRSEKQHKKARAKLAKQSKRANRK
jgi:hypothetical protein